MGSKVSYFFFPRKSSPVIHSFKSQNAVFFFPAKRYNVFFSFPGKFCRPFIRILKSYLFLTKKVCVFFLLHFCAFFVFFLFHGKVHMSFIHSISGAGKKKQPGVKKTAFSFIHSIFLKKCTKTNFSGKKKYDTFATIIDSDNAKILLSESIFCASNLIFIL